MRFRIEIFGQPILNLSYQQWEMLADAICSYETGGFRDGCSKSKDGTVTITELGAQPTPKEGTE